MRRPDGEEIDIFRSVGVEDRESMACCGDDGDVENDGERDEEEGRGTEVGSHCFSCSPDAWRCGEKGGWVEGTEEGKESSAADVAEEIVR